MSGFGTDVVALTCILCGGAVGGAATLALMRAQDEMDVRCAVATVEESPNVVVAIGGREGAVVVRPRVRMRASHGCAAVRLHEAGILLRDNLEIRGVEISQAIELEEQIRLSLEMMEGEMERVQVHIEGIQLEKLEALESALEHEMEQLEERLEKSGGEF